MGSSVRFRCQNPHCRLEEEVCHGVEISTSKRTCKCGSPMKKVYKRPELRRWSGAGAEQILVGALEPERSNVQQKRS